MTRWSDIRIMGFLDIYEKHECLWNPKVESYKNKTVRDEALEAIIKELNIPHLTPGDIRLKIKGIRTTYKRELTSVMRASKDNTGEKYVPKLFWFKRADSFLREVAMSRKSINRLEYKKEELVTETIPDTVISLPQSSYKTEIIEECESEKHLHEENEEDMEEEQIICNGLNDEDMLVETISETDTTCDKGQIQSEQQQQQQEQQIRQHQLPQQQVYEEKPSQTESNTCSIQSVSRDEDECMMFCRSVAAQLRAIPDAYSRSVAKFKIQQIIFEAETGHYRKSAYITIPVTQELSNL